MNNFNCKIKAYGSTKQYKNMKDIIGLFTIYRLFFYVIQGLNA